MRPSRLFPSRCKGSPTTCFQPLPCGSATRRTSSAIATSPCRLSFCDRYMLHIYKCEDSVQVSDARAYHVLHVSLSAFLRTRRWPSVVGNGGLRGLEV